MIRNFIVLTGLLMMLTAGVHGAELKITPGDCFMLKNAFTSKLWSDAVVIKDFKTSVDFATMKPAENQTEVKMLCDGKNLYLLFRASDKEIKKIKADAPPVDGYLNRFPGGDHIEMVIFAKGGFAFAFAFDLNGNKYLSINSRTAEYCWYELATRKTATGWEAIVTIPLERINLVNSDKKRSFSMQVVRHQDHGKKVTRSFVKGNSLKTKTSVSLVNPADKVPGAKKKK